MKIIDFLVICAISGTLMFGADYLRAKEQTRLAELEQQELVNEKSITIDLYMPESYFELYQYSQYITEQHSDLEQALRTCLDRDI